MSGRLLVRIPVKSGLEVGGSRLLVRIPVKSGLEVAGGPALTNMLLKPSLKGEPRFIRSICNNKGGLFRPVIPIIIGQAGSSGSFCF